MLDTAVFADMSSIIAQSKSIAVSLLSLLAWSQHVFLLSVNFVMKFKKVQMHLLTHVSVSQTSLGLMWQFLLSLTLAEGLNTQQWPIFWEYSAIQLKINLQTFKLNKTITNKFEFLAGICSNPPDPTSLFAQKIIIFTKKIHVQCLFGVFWFAKTPASIYFMKRFRILVAFNICFESGRYFQVAILEFFLFFLINKKELNSVIHTFMALT